MATQFNFVSDKTTDNKGQQIGNLNYYGQLSENAKLEWEPIPFKPLGRVTRATSSMMASTISKYYSCTFHDLRGVNLLYEPMNRVFVTEFYFSNNISPVPDGKIKNLIDLTQMPKNGDSSNNYYYRRQIITNRVNGKKYTLNDETKLLLSDIMYGGRGANKPNNKNWNKFIQEITVPASNASFNSRAVEVLIKVSQCFDFNSILFKLFGPQMLVDLQAVNDNNDIKGQVNLSPAVYRAKFERYYPNEPGVFIFNIEQYDKEKVKELTLKENPIRPSAGGIIYY